MKLRPLRFLFSLLILPLPAAATDTLTLRLQDAIALAGEESAEVQRARNTFLAAYWNYRNFRANRLPSVTLTSSPSINRELNKIVQAARRASSARTRATLTSRSALSSPWAGREENSSSGAA